jgi:dihydrofolate reductase
VNTEIQEEAMRRIINSTNVSLDGLIDKMELWHFDYVNDELSALVAEDLFACDALLMGRATYDIFASAWPARTGDAVADKFNAMAKYVASSTLKDPEWNNTTVIVGDLVEEVAKLKQQPGQDIIMYGFGPVARTLLDNGLLDEIRIWVHPVLAGTGELSDMLFSEGSVSKLTLVGNKPLGSGVVVLSYQPVGAS